MINLRDYQDKAISDLRESLRRFNSVLFTMPTGAGKTAVTAFMFSKAAVHNPCWFIVHRRELVHQASLTFQNFGIEHGLVASGQPSMPHYNMQICMVQTLGRRMKKLRPPKFIVWDECHHAASRTWKAIHAAYPDAKHIGLTATPQRLDGKALGDLFQFMVEGPTVSWLIENKYLSDYKLYAPVSISMKGARTQFGEYSHQDVESILDQSTIVGDSIKHYMQLAPGKRGIGFCHSIKHSKLTTQAFNEAGIPAAHIDGSMPPGERDCNVRAFRNGDVNMLFNVAITEEGFDLPGAEVLLDLSPTQSLGRMLQRYGRVLRPAAEKAHAIIIDAVGNSMRHGLPDDERQWSLEGRKKRKRSGDEIEKVNTNFRLCPVCFAANSLLATNCKECKAELPREEREVREVDGELGEVDKSQRKPISPERIEVAKARTFEELLAIGQNRGYKNPSGWAFHLMKARGIKQGN